MVDVPLGSKYAPESYCILSRSNLAYLRNIITKIKQQVLRKCWQSPRFTFILHDNGGDQRENLI